jgi:hypothetical protein
MTPCAPGCYGKSGRLGWSGRCGLAPRCCRTCCAANLAASARRTACCASHRASCARAGLYGRRPQFVALGNPTIYPIHASHRRTRCPGSKHPRPGRSSGVMVSRAGSPAAGATEPPPPTPPCRAPTPADDARSGSAGSAQWKTAAPAAANAAVYCAPVGGDPGSTGLVRHRTPAPVSCWVARRHPPHLAWCPLAHPSSQVFNRRHPTDMGARRSAVTDVMVARAAPA